MRRQDSRVRFAPRVSENVISDSDDNTLSSSNRTTPEISYSSTSSAESSPSSTRRIPTPPSTLSLDLSVTSYKPELCCKLKNYEENNSAPHMNTQLLAVCMDTHTVQSSSVYGYTLQSSSVCMDIHCTV